MDSRYLRHDSMDLHDMLDVKKMSDFDLQFAISHESMTTDSLFRSVKK